MQYYLSVRDSIENVNTREVENSNELQNIKPRNCFWATEFNLEIPQYNDWVEYMINHPYLLFYKSNGNNPFCKKCFIFTLKKDAKIYVINDTKSLLYLAKEYPKEKIIFDSEKLSDDYDGFYIDLNSLMHDDLIDKNLLDIIVKNYCVNSLILFNTYCVNYYYEGNVSITPFDYEYEVPYFIEYVIEYENIKKEVKPKQKKYLKVNPF